MAFRKESKNEEGSGCNDSSMDAVQVFLFQCLQTSWQTFARSFKGSIY